MKITVWIGKFVIFAYFAFVIVSKLGLDFDHYLLSKDFWILYGMCVISYSIGLIEQRFFP